MFYFATKEIFVLEESFSSFGLGDYYIDCDWKEQESIKDLHEVDILVFYCPLHYMKKGPE